MRSRLRKNLGEEHSKQREEPVQSPEVGTTLLVTRDGKEASGEHTGQDEGFSQWSET